MEKFTITAVITLALVLIGLIVSMVFEPTGFKVTCNEASFSMPAGTMDNALNASKDYTGCTIEKMKF